jgi:hypothetical protein
MTETIEQPKTTQGDKRRQITTVLITEYGLNPSRDMFDHYVKLFCYGVPQMEKMESWDAVDFILDDNIELFAFFIYGLNAWKNYKQSQK